MGVISLLFFWWFWSSNPITPSPENSSSQEAHLTRDQALQVLVELGFQIDPMQQRAEVVSHIHEIPVLYATGYQNSLQTVLMKTFQKPFILHFWGTWCSPCCREIEEINTFIAHSNRSPLIVCVANSNETPEGITQFLQDHKLQNINIGIDSSGSLASFFHIQNYPQTLLLDENGYLIGRMIGTFSWNHPQVLKAFKTLFHEDHQVSQHPHQ